MRMNNDYNYNYSLMNAYSYFLIENDFFPIINGNDIRCTILSEQIRFY